MATINFVDGNNNVGQVYSFSHRVAPCCLVGCDQNGTKHYIPTDGAEYTSYDEDMGSYINRYSYSSSSSSLHAAIKSDVATDVINAYNTVSVINKYDIPAGTYTPSAFESLISTFIGRNTMRQVANDFSVTVGGAGSGTVQCLAGSYIGYSNPTLSTYAANPHSVRFNYTGAAARLTYPPDWSGGLCFSNRGIYITYAVTGQSANNYNFNGYANFNISVTTGIKFV